MLIPAKILVVASQDGTALLRIEPGNDSYQQKPGNGSAHAFVYKRNDQTGGYDVVSSFALRNPIAPAIALISNGGRFVVTFDDWNDGVGCTPNVAVVYRGSGEVIKAWALEDIFTAKQIERFPKYINSTNRPWRGPGASFIELEKRDPVVFVRQNEWHDGLQLDLGQMKFLVSEGNGKPGQTKQPRSQ